MLNPIRIFPWSDQTTASIWAALNYPACTPMVWVADGRPESIKAAATNAKAIKDPENRCLHLWALNRAIYRHPLDGPVDFAHGIALCKPIATAIARAMPALSMVVLDDEDSPNWWNLTDAQRASAAATMGMPLPTDAAGVTAFNAACGLRARAAVREAIFDIFRKYLRNADLSSFGDLRSDANDGLTDANGWPVNVESLTGTVCAPAMYGNLGLLVATQSPYSDLIYNQNFQRTCVRHAPGALRSWLTGDNIDGAGAMRDSGYWKEHIIHSLLLCDGEVMLFDANQPELPAKIVAIVDDITQHAGGDLPDELIEAVPIATDAKCFVTARARNRNYPGSELLARVTFAPGVTSAAVVICGQTINVKCPDGECGMWVSGAVK